MKMPPGMVKLDCTDIMIIIMGIQPLAGIFYRLFMLDVLHLYYYGIFVWGSGEPHGSYAKK